MILKIWLQCLFILMVMAIPMMAIQHYQHIESIQLIQNLDKVDGAESLLNQQMKRLQELAHFNHEQEQIYKQEFFELVKYKKSLLELQQLQNSIMGTIEKQSLANVVAVLIVSVFLSMAASWNIVRQFKKLLQQKEVSLKKEHELQRLEQWQNTARALVHEIRAPLTPIKLITSAWQSNLEESKSTNAVSNYIANTHACVNSEMFSEGLEVINDKLRLIENMISRFTVFAKLPSPEYKSIKLSVLVDRFIEQYQSHFKLPISFTNHLGGEEGEPFMLLDEGLWHNAFYAMVKNAIEANACMANNQKHLLTKIEFVLSKNSQKKIILTIANNGKAIADTIVESLFQFGVSSKLTGSHNFGIGLAMVQKITLEHQASVRLAENKEAERVAFEFCF